MASSKNTHFWKRRIDSPFTHMDGQNLASQVTRDHITALLEETLLSEERLLTHITNAACMLELKFLVLTLR
jgi:hypothetical protein